MNATELSLLPKVLFLLVELNLNWHCWLAQPGVLLGRVSDLLVVFDRWLLTARCCEIMLIY